MSKHTPGPWKAIQERGGEDWRVNSEDWGDIVYRTCYPDKKVDTRVEADARLIAAAPELLEALCGLLHAFPGEYATPPDHIVKARAAIAKAQPTNAD